MFRPPPPASSVGGRTLARRQAGPQGPERGDAGENRLPRVGGQTGTAEAGGGRRDRRRLTRQCQNVRRLGRQPERAQQAPHGVGLGHRPHDPARAGTAGTDEDLDREHAAEQRGPRQPSRRPRGLGASRLGVTRSCRHERRAPAGMRGQYPVVGHRRPTRRRATSGPGQRGRGLRWRPPPLL